MGHGNWIGLTSRKVEPPPATPWGKLELEWRMKVSPDCHWRGSLKEVLKAAAETRARSQGKPRPWPSPEEFLVRWAKAHRWIVVMDPENDLVTIRPDPGKQPPKQKPPKADAIQPSLFD